MSELEVEGLCEDGVAGEQTSLLSKRLLSKRSVTGVRGFDRVVLVHISR